jgi:hypothetical protein
MERESLFSGWKPWLLFLAVLLLHPLVAATSFVAGIHRHSPEWYLRADDIVTSLLWFPSRLIYPLFRFDGSFSSSVAILIAQEIFSALVWGLISLFVFTALKRLTMRWSERRTAVRSHLR